MVWKEARSNATPAEESKIEGGGGMGDTGETDTTPKEARAAEGRVRVLVGWCGLDYSRPDEPNIDVSRLEYPLFVQDPEALSDDPAVDESGYREIRDDADLKAWADREFEWWEVKEL